MPRQRISPAQKARVTRIMNSIRVDAASGIETTYSFNRYSFSLQGEQWLVKTPRTQRIVDDAECRRILHTKGKNVAEITTSY